MERPQGVGSRAQGHLPGHRCRRRRNGADGIRSQLLGPAPSRHRPELAAGLERSHPVLCVPGRGPPDQLHHECHRGAEFEAGARPRSLPQRRGRYQAALSDLEPSHLSASHIQDPLENLGRFTSSLIRGLSNYRYPVILLTILRDKILFY